MNRNTMFQNSGQNTMIGSLLGIIFAVLIFINPLFFVSFVIMFAGITAIVFGAIALIRGLMTGMTPAIVGGAIGLLIGILVVVFRAGILVFLPVFIGLMLLIGSVVKITDALALKEAGVEGWWINLVFALVSIAFAIFVLCRPISSQIIFFRVMAVFMIADDIGNIISKKRVRDFNGDRNDNVIDGEGREL